MTRELERIASDRDWYGYLTLENLDAVADRIQKMIGSGQRYTWVAVNEYFGYKAEVRTGQRAEKVQPSRREIDGHVYGSISVPDAWGVWGIDTEVPDQNEARKRGSGDKYLTYVHITHNKIEMSHFAPAGHRLFWVVALERES